jgi:hypothetical protein
MRESPTCLVFLMVNDLVCLRQKIQFRYRRERQRDNAKTKKLNADRRYDRLSEISQA